MGSTLKFLTFYTFLYFLFTSCRENKINNRTVRPLNDDCDFDTFNYAVLKFDTTDHWLFKNAKPANLTQQEIKQVEVILEECIDAYNEEQKIRIDSMSGSHFEYNQAVENFFIDLQKYQRQYFPVINSTGQKEVWVNCFCNNLETEWRKEMLMVEDGGNCYFSVLISLTTNTFSRFMVNGEA